MQNNINNADKMKRSSVEAFKQIQNAANEAFTKIKDEGTKTSISICDNAKKTADYQAQYDALMNEKRTRTLSAAENKRARILKSNIDYYKNLRDNEFEEIKLQHELGEISTDEYYCSLSSLRDAYFKKGSEEWNKYTLDIIEYNRDVVNEQQKELETMLSDIENKYSDSYSNLLKNQTSLHKKLEENLGNIYETVQFDMGDGKPTEWLRLSNIDEDLQLLKNYNNSLIKAKEKANEIFEELKLDDEKTASMKSKFFEQITSLTIREGYAFSNHITNTPDEELTDFISKWVQKIDLSEAISKNLYADESSRIMENYAHDLSNSFTKTLSEKFSTVPDTFFANGISSALEFKNGFISVIDEALEKINIHLNNKISALMPDVNVLAQGNSVTNNSSYNIYGTSSPAETVLELYKLDEKKKMLTGN